MADEVELKIFASDTTEGTMDDVMHLSMQIPTHPLPGMGGDLPQRG